MKRVLVIYEGAAGEALDELEGATALSLARNNNASVLVSRGCAGLLDWSADDVPDRTEYRLATLLGLAHHEARTIRRGPVEALGTRVDPTRWTYAYRGNYVPLDGDRIQESRVSGLTLDETTWLTDYLRETFRDGRVQIEVLDDARVSVMFDRLDGRIDAGVFPHTGSVYKFEEKSRKGPSDRALFMEQCIKALAGQTLNDVRVDLGENPASALWLWAGGPPVETGRPFLGAPLKAAMVSNSPLARGMASMFRMKYHPLGRLWDGGSDPAMIETDTLRRCIQEHELTVIYVEGPREGGSFGEGVDKVKGIDRIDIHVLGALFKAVGDFSDTRVMVTAIPEEGTGLETTPMLLSGCGVTADRVTVWNEESAAGGAAGVFPAERCLTKLIGD